MQGKKGGYFSNKLDSVRLIDLSVMAQSARRFFDVLLSIRAIACSSWISWYHEYSDPNRLFLIGLFEMCFVEVCPDIGLRSWFSEATLKRCFLVSSY
jgi:hypothetical protein